MVHMHCPFFNTKAPQGPQQDLPTRDRRRSQGRQKQSRAVCWRRWTFLQLVNNEDGISGTSIGHKAELHIIDVHQLSDIEV